MNIHITIFKKSIIKPSVIFGVILTLPFISSGQKNQKFLAFLGRFPEKSLPAIIAYKHNEFDYGYYSDENLGDENDSSKTTIEISGQEYQNSVLIKDDSLVIPYALMQQYLLADTESVQPNWLVDSLVSDTINPTYYISSKLNTGKSFHCVIYEMQYWIGSGSNAEKYLSTLNKKG